MPVKAQRTTQIRNIISVNNLTQRDACKILDLSQPKLSSLLNGKFRGISEATMLDCLTRLGRDVQIVIGSHRYTLTPGRISPLIGISTLSGIIDNYANYCLK